MYTENTESAPTRSGQAPFTKIGTGKRTEGTRHADAVREQEERRWE